MRYWVPRSGILIWDFRDRAIVSAFYQTSTWARDTSDSEHCHTAAPQNSVASLLGNKQGYYGVFTML
jgi:hypothetical protein